MLQDRMRRAVVMIPGSLMIPILLLIGTLPAMAGTATEAIKDTSNEVSAS